MIRIYSLCARGYAARGYRFSVAHEPCGAKITASYQVVTTRRQSRFVKKVPTHSAKRKVPEKVIDVNSLFKPVPVSFPVEGAGEGREIAGPLEQDEVEGILNKFFRKGEIRLLASENGLEGTLFNKVFSSFRNYCLNLDALPPELYIRIKDISQDAGHPDDLFPYFLDHAKNIFPHLSSMEELKKISDLSTPANWYPEARSLERKIIYHAGPTNSGKTYQAIKRLFEAESGIYCAPLKLLANEICQKSNAAGTPCDLVTGEERRFASLEGPSSHIACTIEMASITNKYKVAVIDEVQMIRDSQRGWAWTRALLGLNAEEIHVCGENSAIDLVKRLMLDTFDEFEVRKYERLSPLHWSDTALESLQNIQAGDCIVCFNKKDIYSLREKLESMGIKCAILYGSLPPGAKLSEAARFNDPDNICKVLLATDSIGMGVNLSVRRIIFNTLEKRVKNSQGEFETEKLSTSQILQIGGRAGRYGMDFDRGEVTTMNQVDIKLLHCLKNRDVELITQAGLHPTSDQIETFAFHLPGSSLADLITIFEGICKLDGEKFFMCTTDTFKTFAKMLEHIPLPLRTKYLLCNSPINTNPFLTSMLLKIARRISNGEAVHATWFRIQIGWPLAPPQTTKSLEHLESVYDAMDLYLWLSYRFVDMFPDVHIIRDMRVEVDLLIQHGVKNITKMSKEKSISLENVTTEKLDEESIDSDETYGKYNANDKRSNQHYISSYDNLFNKSMNEKNGRLAKVERTTGFEIPEELIEKYEREDNILSTSLLGKRRKILKTREKREDYTLNTPLVNKMRKSSKTKSVPKNPNIHKARRTPIEARNYTNLDNQSREDKKEKYLSEIPLKVRLNNFFKQLPAITEKMISTFPEKSVRCRSEMQNEKSEKKDSGVLRHKSEIDMELEKPFLEIIQNQSDSVPYKLQNGADNTKPQNDYETSHLSMKQKQSDPASIKILNSDKTRYISEPLGKKEPHLDYKNSLLSMTQKHSAPAPEKYFMKSDKNKKQTDSKTSLFFIGQDQSDPVWYKLQNNEHKTVTPSSSEKMKPQMKYKNSLLSLMGNQSNSALYELQNNDEKKNSKDRSTPLTEKKPEIDYRTSLASLMQTKLDSVSNKQQNYKASINSKMPSKFISNKKEPKSNDESKDLQNLKKRNNTKPQLDYKTSLVSMLQDQTIDVSSKQQDTNEKKDLSTNGTESDKNEELEENIIKAKVKKRKKPYLDQQSSQTSILQDKSVAVQSEQQNTNEKKDLSTNGTERDKNEELEDKFTKADKKDSTSIVKNWWNKLSERFSKD